MVDLPENGEGTGSSVHSPGSLGGASPENTVSALKLLAGKAYGGYRSVGAMVYDILRDAILNGILVPGQKLRQEALAEAIGVSRVPVRSAIIQLEADGLVEVFDRRGAVVRSLSADQVAEIYDLRGLLESHALGKSMRAMTPERIARLRELASAADAQNEGAEFVNARSDFYAELYDAANNALLWEAIEDFRLKVGRYMLGWRLAGGHGHNHTELVESVEKGDVRASQELLLEHLESVRDGVLSIIAGSLPPSAQETAEA